MTVNWPQKQGDTGKAGWTERTGSAPTAYQERWKLRITSFFHVQKYKTVRDAFLPKFANKTPSFPKLTDSEKMEILLGENVETISLAGQFIQNCHKIREENVTQHIFSYVLNISNS